MGRPRCGTLGSFDKAIQEEIDRYRPGSEGWGAITIQVELSLDSSFGGMKIPSVSTINRYLKQRNRLGAYRMVHRLPHEPCVSSQKAHQVWQLDAEGNKTVAHLGPLCMINIKDTFSKTYVQSYPLLLATKYNHPTTRDYQKVMRLAFMEFGRCEKLQVDHESVFYENSRTSPFPTPFHLWILGMGINLCYTPSGKPYKQGAVERKHQTMDRQVFQGKTYTSFNELFAACQKRRARMNQHFPCRMLDQCPPLKAYPQAIHSGTYYDPTQEHLLFNQQFIFDFLTKGKWYRKVSQKKAVTLGGRTYRLKPARPNSETQITFNNITKRFRFCDEQGHLLTELEPKGMSFSELAGDLEAFNKWVKENPLIIFYKKPKT